MKKSQLRKKEIKDLINILERELDLKDFLSKKDKVDILEDEFKIILINDKVSFFYFNDKIIPLLKLVLEKNFLKKIVIDLQAVKFIANGADLMRPGIKEVNLEIDKDEIIAIVDEVHGKPLAIGKALFSGSEINEMKGGKVVVNIHHVGDKLWKLSSLNKYPNRPKE